MGGVGEWLEGREDAGRIRRSVGVEEKEGGVY